MSKVDNKKVGKKGEDIASEYLQEKDFQILERNWGSKWGEIDIIAKDGDELVFVEVKTKRGEFYGSPERMIDRKKVEKVRNTAMYYEREFRGVRRIDVVAVVLSYSGETERVNHYQAAGQM